ncbi:MAG: helix-turn-helix transcriptional regulator [Lachnospiraceae bacterium]|nr:helix-turn-helix transcriptional regulator [Lachnospiraceae bacterium]
MDQIKIGQFIARMRKEKNLTQRQLADILDISDKTISKWETGNGLPDVSLMMPLCETLTISVNELLSGERLVDRDYKDKAEENMLALLKGHYRRMLCMAVLSIVSTALVVCIGAYLSLHVSVAQATWLGNAQIQFDGGSFMASVMIFLGFALLFGVIQMVMSRVKRFAVKCVPIAINIAGLLFCLVTYLGAFGASSPSVVAENQYFAMFLCIPVGGGFVGCLLGMLFSRVIEKR